MTIYFPSNWNWYQMGTWIDARFPDNWIRRVTFMGVNAYRILDEPPRDIE